MLTNRVSSRRYAAFTLIEMIIVVAILGVLLALSAPSFRTMLLNAQIRGTSESVLAGLQLARSEALRRNTNVTFWMVNNTGAACALNSAGTSWVVSLDNPAALCNVASSAVLAPRIVQVRAASEMGGNATVNGTNAANAVASCVTFNGFGSVLANCTGTGAAPLSRIQVSSAAANAPTFAVTIERAGAVRLAQM